MEDRIVLNNVSKKFKIGYKKSQGALPWLISFFSGRESKREFFVLKNISFNAKVGENIGIIGKNGSGKSTLLRVIAGVYNTDEGIVKTNGKIIYLTGFGQGINPKLTMRENIYLVGSILGFSQKEIKKRFDEIVDFSGLKGYVDTKIYQFSSGMLSRLSISITLHFVVHNHPDILLLDEVFAGGADIDFQSKSLEKMEELIKSGATVIFCSHDLEKVKKYCDKVIWIDKGVIVKEGGSEEIVEEYKKNAG